MAHDLLAWILDTAFLRTIVSFAVAFALGTLIGAERQWRQRSAGLRTNVLVAVGAAAFTDLGARLLGRRVRPASSPTSSPVSASWGQA
jgi:uncharacterized membrane protein YhiD involved in acid resistance